MRTFLFRALRFGKNFEQLEVYPALFVHFDDLHLDDVADIDHVRDLGYALVGELGDVDHSVFARSDVDERTELLRLFVLLLLFAVLVVPVIPSRSAVAAAHPVGIAHEYLDYGTFVHLAYDYVFHDGEDYALGFLAHLRVGISYISPYLSEDQNSFEKEIYTSDLLEKMNLVGSKSKENREKIKRKMPFISISTAKSLKNDLEMLKIEPEKIWRIINDKD